MLCIAFNEHMDPRPLKGSVQFRRKRHTAQQAESFYSQGRHQSSSRDCLPHTPAPTPSWGNHLALTLPWVVIPVKAQI